MSSWQDLVRESRTHLFRGTVRGRYAPSPTGPMHLGNLRTALIAWLQARLCDGAFVLRMEDLDQPRTVEGSAEEILDDLKWMGLDWDEGPDVGGSVGPYTQSERDEIYAAAIAYLDERGLLFRCYCSRKDIAEASSAPHGRTLIYPGTCRHLTPAQEKEVQAQKGGKTPAWRFRVDDEMLISFDDQIAGPREQDLPAEVGDFVVKRADGLYAYQLAVVIDDLLMGITDIVRGEDLLDSTPRQIVLFEALGARHTPRFWHVPLMVDEEGSRLSKRDGSDSLRAMRASGKTPAEIVGTLAYSLGWTDRDEALSAQELLEELTIEDIHALEARDEFI